MIVLAISALLFVMAIAALGGKEAETAFVTAANTLKSQYIEYLAYDSDGYFNYNSGNRYTCNNTSSPPTVTPTTKPSLLGTSSSCIFLGSIFEPNLPKPYQFKLKVDQIWGATYNTSTLVSNYAEETYLYNSTINSVVKTPQTLKFDKMTYNSNQPLNSGEFIAAINSNSAKGGSQLGLGLEIATSKLSSGSFKADRLKPVNQVVVCYINSRSRYAVYYFSEGNGTIGVNLKLQNQC